MAKLSEYVAAAAAEYLRETGSWELNPRWVAEFFQDSGALDEYPQQDLVAFGELVQKALTKQSERAGKEARCRLAKIGQAAQSKRRH